MTPTAKFEKGAIISDCGKYRYQLWRIWDESKPFVMWVMHNPSKADASEDDPTITRCIGFTKSWGYGGLYVTNLSPFRATNPKDMKGKPAEEIVPIENVFHIREVKRKCSLHVMAYGNPVLKWLTPAFVDPEYHYLKLTKAGNPYHPLYLKGDLTPIKFY